jgi:hypothetical protein
MAIDFEMTPRQRKLKADAREFAREVLRPMSERADAIADPQEAHHMPYRESIVFPLDDAGNPAMQQCKTWGVMADPGFTKSMEAFGIGAEI